MREAIREIQEKVSELCMHTCGMTMGWKHDMHSDLRGGDIWEMLARADDLLNTADIALDGWEKARKWHEDYEKMKSWKLGDE